MQTRAQKELTMNRLILFVLYVATVSLIVFPSLSLAQTSTNASISGTVRDASGAVVPGAQVTVRNTDTGVAHASTTDGAGFYYIPNLISGPYEVNIKASGLQ